MQPYFLPYIGYFQLINAVDKFVVYDNIQYTKKGWVNRNRILVNEKPEYISLPLKKDSDYLNIINRQLSTNFDEIKNKLIRKIRGAYQKAPFYNETIDFFEEILDCDYRNLFEFILNSIKKSCNYLNITTEIIISSSLEINHKNKGEDRVISICKQLRASEYINPIGGVKLYSKDRFIAEEINLHFLESKNLDYKQFGDVFISHLSLLDVLMFNSLDDVKNMLSEFIIK